MTKDMIRYDLLTQDALRGVVRRVLGDVARTGLPGDHHFFIAFATDYPGVRVSQRLAAQYPHEMTIVLQHQFWDLAVTEHAFEVGLSFSGAPERLLVPFDAITQFFDPSANFGLKFEPMRDEAPAETPAPTKPIAAVPPADNKPAPAKKAGPRGAGTEPTAVPPQSVPRVRSGKAETAKQEPPPDEPDPPANGGATVVRLDRFRKK